MKREIVLDAIRDIIRVKIDRLKTRGVIQARYDELCHRLSLSGYEEREIRRAITELRDAREIRCRKIGGVGYLREVEECDERDGYVLPYGDKADNINTSATPPLGEHVEVDDHGGN